MISVNGVSIEPRDISYFRRVGTANDAWYTTNLAGTFTAETLTANDLYAIPFVVPKSCTLDRIAINVTVGAADKLARLGIYGDSSIIPNNLLLDTGDLSVAASGVVTSTISQVLQGGALYWLAFVSNGTPTIRTYNNFSNPTSILGTDNTLGTSALAGYKKTITYGALPNPFNGGGVYSGLSYPAVYVRILT